MGKFLIGLVLGAAVGIGGMMYKDDAQFRAQANAHIDAATAQAATAVHQGLQSAANETGKSK
jgi:hypothetical protein